MKMQLLGMLTVSALLGITLVPAASAQDPQPEATAEDAGRRGPQARGERRRAEGPRLVRRVVRPSPGNLITRLDTDGDERISTDEFAEQPLRWIDVLFERRDQDGNGTISLEESENGQRPDRRGNRQRQRGPQIDREAVLACIRETYPDHEPARNLALADRFEALDTNGDAQLSLDEVTAATESRRDARFARIDADGDDYINEAEIVAHAQEQRDLRKDMRTCSRQAREQTVLR